MLSHVDVKTTVLVPKADFIKGRKQVKSKERIHKYCHLSSFDYNTLQGLPLVDEVNRMLRKAYSEAYIKTWNRMTS